MVNRPATRMTRTDGFGPSPIFNGITTTYTYDDAGRLTDMTSQVASHHFTLDENGNRIHSDETEPLTALSSLSSTAYVYNDKKNRLLSAGDLNYGYDDALSGRPGIVSGSEAQEAAIESSERYGTHR